MRGFESPPGLMILDWHTFLAFCSSAILLGGVFPYAQTIIRGGTRPNPFSLLGWVLLSIIPAVAQIVEGAGWSVVIPLLSAFNSLIILFVSLKYGKLAPLHPTDKYAFALGVVAVGAWILTREPLMAIFISIAAEICIGAPTLAKTYRDPSTEPVLLWLAYVVACVMGLFALSTFELHNIAYGIYAALFGLTVTTLASRKYLKHAKIAS